ncbi:carbon dioxide-concentrating mechanism protein CcmK [Gloeobacter kilaueensis]|uniref:Carbon dioxide concentrating mechanism protein CcmO n=1 Tax=Gloeobacter kilaueensis (strain ATCC BAA-2537 / CCAP 1431/1 / ULC 316 / JS1) TaxID=1183438 RepID=U5QDE5_GLOK1|nr:BMC domain-containing protein [Gloeobacter kilaueensis]AGY56906.1 carbon dioxide concentrating mechanism protein CcmO [Gloeobacter kilaueensis JS1]
MQNTVRSSARSRGGALGLITCRSFPAIVGTADMMLKAARVYLLGYEKIGSGYCTAVIRGGLADVRIAMQTGRETAEEFGQLISSSLISNPLANLEAILPIGSRLGLFADEPDYDDIPYHDQAVGLLETRGFPALVGSCDSMVKAADVHLVGYEKTGAALCTAVIRGKVGEVIAAIDVGMSVAEQIGELSAIMVIPRPLSDLERTLPLAQALIQQKQPLQIPLEVKQPVQEPLILPERNSN